MTHFVGEYKCKIDSKGRLSLPAALLKQFPADYRNAVVLKRSVYEKCIELYPLNAWEKKLEQLDKINTLKRDQLNFVRHYLSGATQVEIDNNNRVLIPKILIEHSEIKKEVVLKSTLSNIEIWAVEKEQEQADSFDPDSFADLADKVMGGGSGD